MILLVTGGLGSYAAPARSVRASRFSRRPPLGRIQQVPQDCRGAFLLSLATGEAFRDQVMMPRLCAFRQPTRQRPALFESTKRGKQQALQIVILGFHQARHGKGVPYPATKARSIFSHFPQNAVTFRTGVWSGFASGAFVHK